MPLSLPADWGLDDAPPDDNEPARIDKADCQDCDAYREAMTDLGKIMLPVEKRA